MSAPKGLIDLDVFKSRVESIPDSTLGKPSIKYRSKSEIELEYVKPIYLDSDYVAAVQLFLEIYSTRGSYNQLHIEKGIGDVTLRYTDPDDKDHEVKLSIGKNFSNAMVFGCAISRYATAPDVEFIRKLNELFLEKASAEDELRTLGADVIKEGLNWDALAGYNEVKNEVKRTVVLPFKHPDVYAAIVKETRESPKSIQPRAVLFHGPPGTGKTTMGKIVAKDMGKPFIYVPIESIFTCWYGESPRRLRKIFDLADGYASNGGCVVFVDEIDALAAKRGEMHEESRRVLSVLLTRLDGIKSREGMVTIGTTNLRDSLDGAIRRRFDEEIYFGLPSVEDRKLITKKYAKHLSDGDIKLIAERMGDLSGSHIERGAKSVERMWAQRKIENPDSTPSLPTVGEYVSVYTKLQEDLAK